jgi:hypothetical protein
MRMDLLTNLIVSSMLTCLIWIVQVLHYPAFRYVDQNNFSNFESFHTKSISYIVMPLMLIELFLSSYMFLKDPKNTLLIVSLISVILIWISTFYFSIPCHTKLGFGYDSAVIEKLIFTNWPRTILWSFKLFISIILIQGVSYERL